MADQTQDEPNVVPDWLQAEYALVEASAQLLVRAVRFHHEHCTQPDCPVRARMLAYMAHSISATKADLRQLPAQLFSLDLKCTGCSGCRGDLRQFLATVTQAAPIQKP